MRILKTEVMSTDAEAVAYDLVVNRHKDIVHAGFAETVINLSPPEGNFLELGTGTGRDAILVAKNTSKVRVTAVDLSDAMLSFAACNARQEKVEHKIDFVKADAKGLPFADKTFDAVFSHHMLHHLPQPERMLAEIKRVVKDDGAIIIRDLIRQPKFVNIICVHVLCMNYTKAMKEEYRKSIWAAFTQQEWLALKNKMNIPGSRLTRQFVTHVSIERPSPRRSNLYTKAVNPFYRRIKASFYISKP